MARHYDPYIAVTEQSLRGVKENIFARLAQSEYFIFIDFKREKLPKQNGGGHRGSLFCHQELALAAFLEKPAILFQEVGVRRLDGIMQFLQGNCQEFSDRNSLVAAVLAEITKRGWRSGWRGELALERENGQFGDESHAGRTVRYFHLKVSNCHISQTALNCYAFLEHVIDLSSNKSLDLKLVEYKWRGVPFPNVVIPYGSFRELDAMLAYHDNPGTINLCSFSDSPRHIHQIFNPGTYRLTFAVHSQNFPCTRRDFILTNPGTTIEEITLLPAELISA